MSVDVLSSLIQIRNRPDRNKMEIRDALAELQGKGYITIECHDAELRNNSTLAIGTTEIQHGFTKVDAVYYHNLTDVDEFALMCVMLKNKEQRRPKVSADELASCIQCERKKAMTVAERLRDKELIVIVDNGYYQTAGGQIRKEKNAFRIRPDSKEKLIDLNAGDNTDENFNAHEGNDVVVNVAGSVSEERAHFDRGNWDIPKAFLVFEDYRILRLFGHLDPHWEAKCHKRLEIIRGVKPILVKNWEEDYQRELNRKEAENQRISAQAQQYAEDLANELRKPTQEQKIAAHRRGTVDISDFVDDAPPVEHHDEMDDLPF